MTEATCAALQVVTTPPSAPHTGWVPIASPAASALLTAARFQRLAEDASEFDRFANIASQNTRRAYERELGCLAFVAYASGRILFRDPLAPSSLGTTSSRAAAPAA